MWSVECRGASAFAGLRRDRFRLRWAPARQVPPSLGFPHRSEASAGQVGATRSKETLLLAGVSGHRMSRTSAALRLNALNILIARAWKPGFPERGRESY